MVGIYKIISPSGKVYIGQSWDIERRWKGYIGKTPKGNTSKLEASFIKYGAENHFYELVHSLPEDIAQDTLDRYEQLYIDFYRDCNISLLNIREAGSRGKLSENTKEKISKVLKEVLNRPETKQKWKNTIAKNNTFSGEKNPMFGKIHKEESIRKMKKAKTDDHKQKLKKPRASFKFYKDGCFICEIIGQKEAKLFCTSQNISFQTLCKKSDTWKNWYCKRKKNK